MEPFINVTNSTIYTQPEYVGFISAGVSVIFFAIAFLPLKKFEPNDGIFYQWTLCSGIFIVGVVVNFIQNSPQLYLLAICGGLAWTLGNVCVVFIEKTIGMGLGFCLWSVTNMLGGWATGRFGLFWTDIHAPKNELLNNLGVAFAVLSVIVYTLVKPKLPQVELTLSLDEDRQHLLATAPHLTDNDFVSVSHSAYDQSVNHGSRNSKSCLKSSSYLDHLHPYIKRALGITLALVSGLIYGFSFTPAIYIQDNYTNSSKNGLDYVFAHFIGIYSMSTIILFIYLILKRNKPVINNKIMLPSFIGGILWGIACASWFVANRVLSETISFPIITTGPPVICNLLTVIVFREITRCRDLLILSVGFSLTITACVLTALSM